MTAKTDLKGSTVLTGRAYADDASGEGTHAPEFSDAAQKLMDMIGDACAKMDESSKRFDERMDAFGARMDAVEADKRKDSDDDDKKKEEDEKKDAAKADDDKDKDKDEPKEPAADKRKDAAKKDDDDDEKSGGDHKSEKSEKEEKEVKEKEKEEEAKADHAKNMADMRAEIAAMHARLPKALSDEERDQFATIQEQADRAFQAFGDRAGPALDGETTLAYKKRLVGKMQKHSKTWASTRIAGIADMAAVDVIAEQVFADAIVAARRGADLPAGHLRTIKSDDGHGHTIIEYEGASPLSWMTAFAGPHSRSEGDFRKPN